MTQHASPIGPGSRVYLIDGSTYIYRAYFAMFKASQARGRAFTRSDGTPVGAVMTFCNMLWKVLRDGVDGGKPTHVAVIFDPPGDTFRSAIYTDYKANREAPPDELIPQFPLVRDAVRAFGLTPLEQAGYEADDLIATYACEAAAAGAEVMIISGDKDLMQLISPAIRMYDPMPGNERRIGEAEVREKFGVGPDKVVDVQALAGDPTDNVPGVPGIGVKTAAQLIQEYGDLDTLLANAASIKQNARRERLIEFADQARISRDLVRLKTDTPIETPLAATGVAPIEPAPLIAFLRAMEFKTLTQRIADALGVTLQDAAVSPSPSPAPPPTKTEPGGPSGPALLAAERLAAMRAAPFDRAAYQTVTDLGRLQEWITAATEQGWAAFDVETNSLYPTEADLVGVSLALQPGLACYIPLAHRASAGLDLDGGAIAQIPFADALGALKPLLEDPSVMKIAHNGKYDCVVLGRYGVRVAPLDDTMLMSYALDSGKGGHGMDELSERHFGHKPIAYKEVCGSGKSQITFDLAPVPRATEYAAEDADVTLRLWHALKPRLAAEGVATVYERLERPLVCILGDMEAAGVKVDRQVLSRLSGQFAQSLGAIEAEIYALAGETFNIGSPKQMADLLFGKLGYPGASKTATGAWSTGARILEDLVASEELTEDQRRLPAKLLEWRQLSKLKSTYTDTLPDHINKETGRIHTCYSLAATSTGRLSSNEPNLQNIPIRTAQGRQIRSAFIAEDGHKLISADYSQIELRVLAHIADIPALKRAFADGLDIHAMTASEMFGVPVEGMPGEVRRRAKAINFGIIYGISSFGLAQQLGIGRAEAGDYIAKYFERFPGIRDYMEATKKAARADGYVKTIFGRKMHFPEINSSNRAMKAFFERAAINAPIQGSAADIIRRAMIRMPEALARAGVRARMLLQVHDELIFEAADAEVDATIAAAVRTMERSAEPAAALTVPIKVDARAALNWDEAH
ncbi:MAG: DNA polymerase I [Hyphomicrobiales bacterium]|nr:DNA polymerase I [Hyphomicrobiales bacterium]